MIFGMIMHNVLFVLQRITIIVIYRVIIYTV